MAKVAWQRCVIPQGFAGPQNPVTVAHRKPPASRQLLTVAAQNSHLWVSFPHLGTTLFSKHSCIYVFVCVHVCVPVCKPAHMHVNARGQPLLLFLRRTLLLGENLPWAWGLPVRLRWLHRAAQSIPGISCLCFPARTSMPPHPSFFLGMRWSQFRVSCSCSSIY